MMLPSKRRIATTAILLVALASCNGCDDKPTPAGGDTTVVSTTLANLSAAAGDAQTAPAGATVTVKVKATGAFASVARGATLSAAASSGGSVSPASVTTDAQGEATLQWTLGRTEGDQTLTVTPPRGESVTFRARATRPVIASISITPASVTALAENDTIRVSASAFDALGLALPGRTFTWTTSDTALLASVTSVAATALLRGVAPGVAQARASSEGVTSSPASITVTRGTVASVAIVQASPTLAAGQTATLTAAARDARGNSLPGRAFAWVSSNPAVATINPTTGLVTGVIGGTTQITATSDGVASPAITLTVVNAPVATVTVSPAAPTVVTGQTTPLTATLRDAGGAILTGRVIAWTSSNTTIATIDGATGVATGASSGTTTITATSEGRTGTVTLTVTQAPVASIDITPVSPTVAAGLTLQLNAVARDAAGNVLTGRVIAWGPSSNTAAATLGATGLVTGVSPGTTSITASSEGRSSSVTLTVTPAPVASLDVTPTSPSVVAGTTVQMSAVPRDAAGNTLTGRLIGWVSSNTAVATINSATGLAAGVTAGTTTLTATSEGRSGSVTLTVTAAAVAVASVDITPTAPVVAVGQTLQMSAVARDAGGNALPGRVITWVSNNSAVATINPATGLVTGASASTTTLTATSEGRSSTVTLTVNPVPVASVDITPAAPTVQVGQTVQLTAVPRDAGGNALTGRVIAWASSNTAFATVNPATGLAAGVSVGTATVSATSEGRSGNVTLTVTPAAALGVGFGPEQFATIPATVTPFQMGSNFGFDAGEQPVHPVNISPAFKLQRTEVTQGQWRAVMGTNPSFFTACGDLCPVEQVSWNDMQLFLQQLNAQSAGAGVAYRLPTEAEWEYAARAGTTTETYGVLNDIAWWQGNATQTRPVAGKAPNAFGLYDMIGNVLESVSDWYGPYSAALATNPTGPATGTDKVFRGGSYNYQSSFNRSAARIFDVPTRNFRFAGFRLVRTP